MSRSRTAGAGIVEFAPAKINLYLHVLGRRTDGYHLLSSLVAFAQIGDEISVRSGAKLTLATEGPFAADLPESADNLVVRAARLLASACELRSGAAIRLTKRLPVSSGIGGGSADAAAALRALAALWRVDPGVDAWARIEAALGADVAACRFGRPALVSGAGETIEPAPPLPPIWLALVNPGVAVPTKDVFAARAGPFSPAPGPLRKIGDAAALAQELGDRRNDLTAAALGLAPTIGEALAALEAAPGCLLARMSGSGATCFGLFAAPEAAQAAARAIAATRPGWWCQAAAALR